MHEAVDNVIDYIHVIRESAHDHAIGSHIKEQIDRCIQNTYEYIVVHLLKCLVNESALDVFFEDLTQGL